MIIVKAQGGLGNQMFQYAFGRALSVTHDIPLAIDTSLFVDYPFHSYGLDRYALHATTLTVAEARRYARMKPRIGRRHFLHNFFFSDPRRYIVERHLPYDESMVVRREHAYYDGYWQTERYFSSIAEIIRDEFTLRGDIDPKTLALRAEMSTHASVSLHVRRGVFANHPVFSKVHGSRGPEYFDRALAYIGERVPNPHIYVFTDDRPWAREHIRPQFPTTYVEHTSAETPHEDILLMSSCAHHILANSTFSWWGAWLNPSPSKIVIGPVKWFEQDKFDTSDILPPTWVRL